MVSANQSALPRQADAEGCTGCAINATTSNAFYNLPQELNPQTTYWWQIRARNGPQGSEWSNQFSFTTVNNIICTRTTITLGRTVTGALTDADCEAPHRPGKKADLYTFSGATNQRVTITLSSTAFDAYLVLVGPNNAVLDEDDDDGDGEKDARISFTLPSAGTYTIEATSLTPSGRGAYTLKLEEGVCPALPISFDTPINGTLSNEDCNAPHRTGKRADRYAFTVTQKQRVTITLNSTAFDAYLILVDGSNRMIVSNDDYGGSNDARIADFTLPSAGTYIIEATAVASSERGTYTLKLIDAECKPLPITPDTPINGSLTDSDCAAPHRAGRRADLYTFTGAAGQRVTITMNSTALDSYLFLIGPDNRTVASNNDWNKEKNARINDVLLRSNGVYTIEATVYGSTERGNYTLRLTLPRTIFLVHGIRQSATDMRPLATTLQDPRYGVDTARFKVDYSFSYSDCAQTVICSSSRCTIPEIAKRLADYINRQNPQGDIIVIGYSLGGLVARDMMFNNYSNVFANRHVAALLTLGTPNAGYPYNPVDDIAACSTLLQQMAGDFRQSSTSVTMSEYLFNLTTRWGSSSFPGKPRVWFAASGTSCSVAERLIGKAGCPDSNPKSDGVVCDQSARFIINAGNRPTLDLPYDNYAHSDNRLSFIVLCAPASNTHLLWNPPADGALVSKMKEVINGLTFTQAGILSSVPVELSVPQEIVSVARMTDSEAWQFLRTALDSRLPQETKDNVYLLAKSRSALAVPEIVQRLTQSLQEAETSPKYIDDLADLIAYAADNSALDQLLQLAKSEPERFGPFLTRLLNYAIGRSNPYLLVYHGLNSADAAAVNYLLEWVENDAASTQELCAWAAALVEMGVDAVTEESLHSDPILSRMTAEKSAPLRKALTSLAQEAIQRRKNR